MVRRPVLTRSNSKSSSRTTGKTCAWRSNPNCARRDARFCRKNFHRNKILVRKSRPNTGRYCNRKEALKRRDKRPVLRYNFRFFGVNHPRGEIGYGKTQESDEIPRGGQEKTGRQEEGRPEESQAGEKSRAAQGHCTQSSAR